MKKRSMEHLLKKPTKKIRILGAAVLAVFAVIFAFYYISVVAPATAKAFSGAGAGTDGDPYRIASCAQLQEMQLDNDAVYVLVNDIDCNDTINWNSGKGFLPILDFKGRLDGRNYAIRGLYVNRTSSGSPTDAKSGFAVGLFRTVRTATIANLWLRNGPSTEGKVAIKGTNNVGSLAGELRFGSVVSNVHSELSVAATGGTMTDKNGAVGGLAGLNRGIIRLSSSTGDVTLLNNSALANKGFKLGGLVGNDDGPMTGDSEDHLSQGVSDSYATGKVTADEADQAFQDLRCGGLVGEQSSLKYITASYAEGTVHCQSPVAASGGLVGLIDGAQSHAPLITSSFTRSKVETANDGGKYGGFYGRNDAVETANNQAVDLGSVYFDVQRTGQENCGPDIDALPCTAINISGSEPDYFTTISNAPFSQWDETIWDLQEGALPVHQVQAVRPDPVANFQVTRDGDDFVFTWDQPLEDNGRNMAINGYTIEKTDLGNGATVTLEGTPDTNTTYRWSGLEIPNSYKFRIRAEVPNGISGLFSDDLEFATGMPSTSPEKDKVESVVHSTIVSWLPVDGATSYDLQYRETGSDAWFDTGGATSALARAVIGLEANTSYDYRVKAINKAGSGPWSEPFAAVTNTATQRAIATCQELQDLVSLEDDYYLANDIDCSAIANFTPIPVFMGTFDGRGHTIRNLTIQVDADSPSQVSGVGLFGSTVNAAIRNLTIEHSSVITNYSLGDSIDEDQNGLPDLNGLTIEPVVLPDGTVGSVASLQQEAVQTALSAGQSAQDLGTQLYITAPQLTNNAPKVSTGTVVGTSFGTSKYQNIAVNDAVVTGAITGGVFGIILPTPQLLSNKFSDAMFSEPMVFDNLSYNGLVFGNVSGGLIGLATSNTGSIFGMPGSLTIQNSRVDATVQANVGGGAVGIALSLSAASTYPVASTWTASDGLFGIGSSEMINAIERTVSTQDVIIKNTVTTGEVSVCDATSQVRMASLGGLVGVGVGVLIDGSQTSAKITACSQTASNWGVYGGFMGGMGGIMAFSRVTDSNASGDIMAINNRDSGQYAPGIFIGSTGGVAGLMFNAADDADGRYAIDGVHTTGNTQISGSRGLVAASGGLTGIYLGSGTFRDSYTTGRIIQAQPDENLMGAMFSGGISGVTMAFDAPFAIGSVFSYLAGNGFPAPTHGLDLKNVHATGDVIAQKSKGGSFSVSGGLLGLMVGEGTVTDSYASGAVSNNLPREVRLKVSNVGSGGSLFEVVPEILGGGEGRFGAAVSGGMIGAAYGIDSVGWISTIASGVTTQGQDQAFFTNKGLEINDSYSSGSVKGNIAGGLIGAAEFKVKVNKTYSTGGVQGDIAGGLIGESGFLSFFPQGGAIYGTIGLIKGYNTNPEYYNSLIKLIDNGIQSLGTIEIMNTYTRGKVTGTPGLLRAEIPEGEDIGYIDVIDKLPVTVGGIIGLNMGPGMKLKDSYASGDILVETKDPSYSKPQAGLPSITNIPNFAGGIVGLNIVMPQISADSEKQMLLEGNGVSGYVPDLSRASFTGNEFTNLFSASRMTINSQTITGGIFGWYFSPVKAVSAFYGGQAPVEISQPDKIGKVSNVYLDKTNIKVTDCSNATKITDVGKDILSNAYIPGPNDQNSVPAWNIPEGYNQVIDSVVGVPACQYVNDNNSQPLYFINNKSNAPLDQWNFSSVWKVQKNDYPKFVAAAETTTPSGPGTGTTTPPTSPPIPSKTATPANSPITKTLNELARRKPGADLAKGDYTWWQVMLRTIPPLLALSIPYLLIAIILALAARYAKQALDQYRELRKYHNAILRLLATKEAINDFLAVTTHYLNTPVAIMRGAVELLQSMKKVPASVANNLSAKITAFAEEASKLITANEVSSAESANSVKPIQYKAANPFFQKEVWLPSMIALSLLMVANVLFLYAGVFTRSWVRIAIEFGCMLLAIGLLAFSYRYRDSIEQSKRVAKQQLDEETVFYKKRQDFIGHAAIVTHDSHLALELASNNLRDLTDARLFFNGLQMLGGIAKSLGNLKTFSVVEDNPPLLDISALARKAVVEAREQARVKNITITSNVAEHMVVRFEPDEMRQLVGSLLDNAIKFGKKNGHIALNVERSFSKVRIQVHDNGEGISREKLPSLLKPFVRGTDSMQYNREGLGLSLYTDKILVDKLGGTISVTSHLNKGTVVTIELPAHHDAKAIIPMLITVPKPV